MDKNKVFALGFPKKEYDKEVLNKKSDVELLELHGMHQFTTKSFPFDKWQDKVLNGSPMEQLTEFGYLVDIKKYYWYIVLDRFTD